MASLPSGHRACTWGVTEHPPHLNQNWRGDYQGVRVGYGRQKQGTREAFGCHGRIGSNEYVRVENDPHEGQLRLGRACSSASAKAASISSGVVSGATFEAI